MLDESLIVVKHEYTLKPEWVVCKYCKVPFLTQTFEDTCAKCKHFVKYKIEFSSKVMLFYTLSSFVNSIFILLITIFFVKFYYKLNILFFTITVFSFFIGGVFWKKLKRILD